MFVQISKCLGKSFQHNGHGVDAKDLAEKMQRLSTEVSKSAYNMFYFFNSFFDTQSCAPSVKCKISFVVFPED